MPAILYPKRPDASRRTSTVIEASTGALDARSGTGGSSRGAFLGGGLARPTIVRLGRVDAEDLLEPAPSQPGNDHRVAALYPFHPTEIEVALRDRGPHRPRDVRASFGPIEAESAQAAGRTPRGQLDPEPGEEPGSRPRDLCDSVVKHEVFAGDERVGEIDAEAARKVVVANSGRAERVRLTRERAISRSLLEGDRHDPLDHAGDRRRGEPEMAMPPGTDHREQAGPGQLREMGAGGLGRDARGQGKLARTQGPAIEKR